MPNTNTNQSRKLQYHYAQILLPSGFCVGSFTSSDEIIGDEYIVVPRASDDYMDKYYDYNTDMWYLDEDYTVEATEINAMYHG